METNTNERKGWAAILISDRGDFRERQVIRNKEGHYIMSDKGVSSSRQGNP